MLKADQVEFGILTLVVNHGDPLGREFSIGDLVNEVSYVAGVNCSDAEIVDALLILAESGLIELGRYVTDLFSMPLGMGSATSTLGTSGAELFLGRGADFKNFR